MDRYTANELESVIFRFQIEGELKSVRPFGNGHINWTYLVEMSNNGKIEKYTLQQINTTVFHNPDQLMENIDRVTTHLRKKLVEAGEDPNRGTLKMLTDRAGEKFYVKDSFHCYWRMYVYIDETFSYDVAQRPVLFKNAARAFGRFQAQLADFPAFTLYETIPHFHDTGSRYLDFETAVGRDRARRAASVQEEIAFVRARRRDTYVVQNKIIAGDIPMRVTHNDTKLNNILMDASDNAVCIIDLDTVMPGSSLYDFGDSIRFGASTAAEDEPDLSKVHRDLALFEAYAEGYLEEAGHALTAEEIDLLPFSAKLMTLECGMRFLTDYLNGDVYFKVSSPDHNLLRARTQFKLVEEDEQKAEEMTAIIRRLAACYCQ